MYYLYYLVISCSLDLCAVYYYYFSAPTQILRAPHSADESGGRCCFPPTVAIQYPMVPLSIWRLLPFTPLFYPCTIHPVRTVQPVLTSHFILLY